MDPINFTIKRNEKVGRYAVADVDLRPGDFIFTEMAFAFGPKSDSLPLCLGCHIPVDCTTLCSSCNWPVCGKQCEMNLVHKKAECAVFAKAKVCFQTVSDTTKPCPQYECITPLRYDGGMLRDNDRWNKEVKDMEAHNEERRNHFIWRFNQINVVNYLRGPCRLKVFDEELIHTVCGILECNAFEIRARSGYPIQGLFPKLAILSHSCISNITHTVCCENLEEDVNFKVAVRAATTVQKGEELLSSYSFALWPTVIRREHLRETKYFECRCDRCADPTEMNTHLSSLICNKCNLGVVTSSSPLGNKNWDCSTCGHSLTQAEVMKLFQTIQSDIDNTGINHLEDLKDKYSSILHPHNSYLIMMELFLIPVYRRTNVHKAIQSCKNILIILNAIEPGCTRVRGTTLYELTLATFVLIDYLQKQNRKELLSKELNNALKYLEECAPILAREPTYTADGKAGIMAKRQLEKLKSNFQNVVDGSSIFDIINNI